MCVVQQPLELGEVRNLLLGLRYFLIRFLFLKMQCDLLDIFLATVEQRQFRARYGQQYHLRPQRAAVNDDEEVLASPQSWAGVQPSPHGHG